MEEAQGGFLMPVWLWPVLAAVVLLVASLVIYVVCRRRPVSSEVTDEEAEPELVCMTMTASIDELIEGDFENPLGSDDFGRVDGRLVFSSDGSTEPGTLLVHSGDEIGDGDGTLIKTLE